MRGRIVSMFDRDTSFARTTDTATDREWARMVEAFAPAPQSAAELVWDALERDEITAVWSTTSAGWPHAGMEDTVVLRHRRADDVAWQADDDTEIGAPTETARDVTAADAAATAVVGEAEAALLLQLGTTGHAGPRAVHLLARDGYVDVGSECEGPWCGDAWLDTWHVRLFSTHGGVRVYDSGSRGGVWLRVDGGRWLRDGERFRVGAQVMRFDAAEGTSFSGQARPWDRGRVQLVADDAPVGPALPLVDEIVLGREAADATFPHDPYVSAHHCRLLAVGDGVWLEDLGSSNGTYVRLRSGDVIPFGSVVTIGASLYRIESGERP
jgi:hypothetical protein